MKYLILDINIDLNYPSLSKELISKYVNCSFILLKFNSNYLFKEPCEKIGIVGRTGSGKSTITLGLLRILEPSMSSVLNLNDIPLTSVGLHYIRQSCTIIP